MRPDPTPLDLLFLDAPVGLAYYDRSLRYVRVNQRLAEINGVPVERHPGRTTAELLPGIADRVEADLRHVIATGEPIIDDVVMGLTAAPSPHEREWIASYFPVLSGSAVAYVGAVIVESTDRRLAERRLRAQTDRYETLLLALSEVGEGMVVLEGDHLVHANAAFEHLTGYGLDELRAMESIWSIIPDWHRSEARRRVALRVGEGLVDPHYEVVITRRDGRLVDLDAAAVPLRVDDRDQLVVVVRDVTARKRAEAQREHAFVLERQAREAAEASERRMALLAAASEVFDASLDEQETLERVARLTVAEVADTCMVILARGGSVRPAIAVARDPERERVLADHAPKWSSALAASGVISRILLTGESMLVRDIPRTIGEAGGAPEHAEATAELRLGGAALVPLRARGRIFGIIGCGLAVAPAPDHERELLTLLEDLARRAALAMDNARLYAERTHVARTLQRSLLPPELPVVPGVELAARYRPAGEGAEVGGDFYDCFATSRGEHAVVIGDVCGKGVEAAAVTALARYAMRASTLHSESPVEVLAELNETLLRQGTDGRFCTVLYGAMREDPRGGRRIRFASGGHPLPLVLREDGTVEQTGTEGTLLGVVPDPALEEDEIGLRPGDALVLYTDGVIEASPLDQAFGPAAFREFVSGLAGFGAAEIARAIEAAVVDLQGGTLRDDVAVLVLRVASAT